MTRERVVFDTNVLISGALSSTSTPARALEKAIND
jgi:predicted nucleic acid-binding protein